MRAEILTGGVIGMVLGGFLGVLGCHVVESNKYMRRLEMEVSNIKASYEKREETKKKEEPTPESVKSEPKQKEPESKPTDEESNQYRDKISIYEGSLNKDKDEQVNYATYSTPPKEEKPVNKKKKKKEIDEDAPYPISDVDFHETFFEFDKVHATWYAQSHVLMQDDETFLDVGMTVGHENLCDWPEDGVIFVRNPALGADYEITYSDSVYDYDLY